MVDVITCKHIVSAFRTYWATLYGDAYFLQVRDYGNSFPPSGLASQSVSYSRHADKGAEMVPYFMKRMWSRFSDLPLQRSFPFRMTDNRPETSAVKKRPFDSIAYNTGLGGFK